jgi:protein-S-isoprenylcysteine O-methyltransferase Ste14
MPEEGQKKEGVVEKIMQKGDLSTRKIKEELWEKNVSFVRAYDRAYSVLFMALVALWLLPAIAEYSGWEFLSLFAKLPRVHFPVVVIAIGAILFIAAISLEAKVSSLRKRQGGCRDEHETVVIVKEGPYKVVRHPGYLAELIYFSLLVCAATSARTARYSEICH